MARNPEQIPIKRVAVLVELVDGSTVAMYAEPDPLHNDAEVDVQLRRPEERVDWAVPGDGARRVPTGPAEVRIMVRGLHEYNSVEDMPAMIGATLDAVKSAVKL